MEKKTISQQIAHQIALSLQNLNYNFKSEWSYTLCKKTKMVILKKHWII